MAQNGSAGKSNGPVPVGHQKASFGMCGHAGLRLVLRAERLVDLLQAQGAIHLGLTFPEKPKTLAAYGTAHIRGVLSGLAKNLHRFDLAPFRMQLSLGEIHARETMTRTPKVRGPGEARES